ncbi:site-2 protease family protein [Eubacteriales bacterium OttesenSCG-928-N13]|nr:site-2 protease family protein [Eubacteriales bacterium OttesenSCG-928-N13]
MLIDLFQAFFTYGIGSEVFRQYLILFLLYLPVFLFSLSFHEAGHAYIAYRCGDPTAYMLGRMTLNPVKHIDPIGFLLLCTVRFGWAKPVPVNPRNYKNYRKDDIKVSLAGICGNLLLVLISTILLTLLIWFMSATGINNQVLHYARVMLGMFISTNIILACFNLLPIPPLDGYHVLNDLILKRPLFSSYNAQRVGQVLILVLIVSGVTGEYLAFMESSITGYIYRFIDAFLNLVL